MCGDGANGGGGGVEDGDFMAMIIKCFRLSYPSTAWLRCDFFGMPKTCEKLFEEHVKRIQFQEAHDGLLKWSAL